MDEKQKTEVSMTEEALAEALKRATESAADAAVAKVLEAQKAEADKAREAEEAKQREAEEAKAREEAAVAEQRRIEELVEAKLQERIAKSPALSRDIGDAPKVPANVGTLEDRLDDESRSFVGALRAASGSEMPREVLKEWFKNRAPLNTGDGEGTGSSYAQYLMPTGLSDMIVRQMAEITQFEPLTKQFNTSAPRGVVPILSNVSVYSKAEGASYTESTPTLSRDQWYAYSFGAYAKMTKETIADSAYDIVSVIKDQFAEALAAEKDKQLLIGQNSDAPYGLYYTAGLTSYAAGGALSYDVLVELEHTIGEQYRDTRRCVFVGSDANLKRIRKLKDSDGRPIFERASAPGTGSGMNKPYPTVLGYRYVNAKSHFPNTQLFFGMPEWYWVWNRHGLVIDLSENGYDGSNDAWLNDEMWLKVKTRFDGMCVLTQAWVKATGITG